MRSLEQEVALILRIAGLLLLCTASVLSSAQDFDTDFRVCDGLPASQRAFETALGNGELRQAALNELNSLPLVELQKVIHSLFRPVPTSLVGLNGRVDVLIPDVKLATALQMSFNQIVASKIFSVSNDNIVCSMSLLSYREASDIFGKRIAMQYGVVQVTMRNTDPNHEFLLHQVDFWFGDTTQYYATRDKKLARGVAEKGQAIDPRNVTVRVLEGIGMVAGPVTNVFSNDAILGSSIYNSSFVPAVKYVFPDLTVQQIAKLDDMGFSAGASTMLIPKSGAISFVAFIPADSFLVPKLAQYEQLLATDDQSQQRIEECSKLQDKQAAIAAKSDEKSRSTSPPQLTAAESQTLSECDELLAPKSTASVPMLSSKTVRSAKGNSTHVGLSSWFTLGMHTSRKTIGSFDPAVVLLLQRDLHILASGSHIQQLTAQLVINSVTCSMPDPLVSDSTVSCALTGNGLNQVTQGRLISQSDSTVSVPSTGLKSTKDDPTHAQLSFPACSFLGKPQGNYLLEISSSSSGTQLYPSAQELKPNGFTCNREAGGVTCHVPSTLAATSITLTGSDKKPNTFTPAGGLVSPQMLASGTYDAAATVSGKAVQLCPVTF